mmetsp:Transcript_57761/g.161096  ORF Transcript_57761/g.161096 Transcript_57761/m.161096 type:complete len:315 (+) Transcript_57761:782-1726(+)
MTREPLQTHGPGYHRPLRRRRGTEVQRHTRQRPRVGDGFQTERCRSTMTEHRLCPPLPVRRLVEHVDRRLLAVLLVNSRGLFVWHGVHFILAREAHKSGLKLLLRGKDLLRRAAIPHLVQVVPELCTAPRVHLFVQRGVLPLLPPPSLVLRVGQLGAIKQVVVLQPAQRPNPPDFALGEGHELSPPMPHLPRPLYSSSGVMDGDEGAFGIFPCAVMAARRQQLGADRNGDFVAARWEGSAAGRLQGHWHCWTPNASAGNRASPKTLDPERSVLVIARRRGYGGALLRFHIGGGRLTRRSAERAEVVLRESASVG